MPFYKQEKKIFFYTLVVLIIFLVLPHIIGFLLADQDYYYIGDEIGRGDYFSHISFINQAKQGHFLFKYLYSTADQRAVFFQPIWLVSGLMAKIFNLSMFFAYHGFRLIFAIIFCFVLRRFLIKYFNLNNHPWLLPFCLFAGGFYTYLTEKDVFTSLLYGDLFPVVLIFLLIIVEAIINYFNFKKFNSLIIITLCSLFLFLTHFYDTATVLTFAFSWGAFKYFKTKSIKAFMPALAVVAGVSVGAIYYSYIFALEPVLKEVVLNGITKLASLKFLIFGYGLILPLAITSLLVKKIQEKFSLIIIWCLSSFYLILSPLPFNRRLVLGVSIPLVILAYFGLEFIIGKINKFWLKATVLNLFILFLIFNSLFAVATDIVLTASKDFYKQNLNNLNTKYIKKNYMETFFWMRDNLPADSGIMANFFTWDAIISAYTGLPSYVAYSVYILDTEKMEKNLWFFQDNNDAVKKWQFLKENRIHYLFYSNIEKRLGVFNPDAKDYLKLIYQNQDARVYQVIY